MQSVRAMRGGRREREVPPMDVVEGQGVDGPIVKTHDPLLGPGLEEISLCASALAGEGLKADLLLVSEHRGTRRLSSLGRVWERA
jgi:hypothetical protein